MSSHAGSPSPRLVYPTGQPVPMTNQPADYPASPPRPLPQTPERGSPIYGMPSRPAAPIHFTPPAPRTGSSKITLAKTPFIFDGNDKSKWNAWIEALKNYMWAYGEEFPSQKAKIAFTISLLGSHQRKSPHCNPRAPALARVLSAHPRPRNAPAQPCAPALAQAVGAYPRPQTRSARHSALPWPRDAPAQPRAPALAQAVGAYPRPQMRSAPRSAHP
ncbi:hypothetical protein B0H17DRAFT_1206864 [Mycena rosella]|uniref:Uncharacterized protein n=1 Tax=Mycena rosella TaxID=1033263 RepID=A0AAD7G8S7_MYCRO|nr:hypothetical protein B0H17DRAFT_1206864 [Mycena rosella]